MPALIDQIDALLDGVCARQAAEATLRLEQFGSDGQRGPAVLHSCAANWSTRADPRKAERDGPRHQTLRRRGLPPPYPRPIDLTRGLPGKLVMLREGLSLEPLDAKNPCTHISKQSIRRTLFYSDCIEIRHGEAERTLIRCDAIDTLDLFFEAYY